MPQTFRPYAPDQMLLLSSSVHEWVPEGDMAHLISDMGDALDLSETEAVYEEELRGYPAHHHPQLPEAGEAGSGRWLRDAGGGQLQVLDRLLERSHRFTAVRRSATCPGTRRGWRSGLLSRRPVAPLPDGAGPG